MLLREQVLSFQSKKIKDTALWATSETVSLHLLKQFLANNHNNSKFRDTRQYAVLAKFILAFHFSSHSQKIYGIFLDKGKGDV